MNYEYKVIPAPTKGLKAKGVKSGADRFANALQTAMNAMAADGWDYLRAETLPSEEREGLMGKTTVFQNVLVFGRAVVEQPVAEIEEETAVDESIESEEQATSDEPAEQDAVEDLEQEVELNEASDDATEETIAEQR